MSEFKQSETLTPRQKHIIESMGKRNQKKPTQPKEVEDPKPVEQKPKIERLMTIGEVADLFRVVPLTIKRWTKAGKISCIRINSRGDRRYLRSEIERILGGTK